ncbi:VOC family protein [Jeotgalicoccus halotolerans]|uniref:VOC family protein n=1 Tax=Jeotgalicoccus halotolerans TaxID=157227 RepID=UPI003512B25C
MKTILGHHHISMLTKNAQENNKFYTQVLGMRRVKVTVNQDDPSMYHLFYGDKNGTPGSELTFFEMPMAAHTRRGTNAVTRIGLFVRGESSLSYWQKRFDEHGVEYSEAANYGGRKSLLFEDGDGLRLALQAAEDDAVSRFDSWNGSAVPEEYQIMSMGTVEMSVRRIEKMERTLTELFDYVKVSGDDHERLYRPANSDGHSEILVKYKDGDRERPGRGSVHHLAINVEDEETLQYWHEQVVKRGFSSTGVVDRHFFKSLYFRESNGIMFELATDGPGLVGTTPGIEAGEKLDLPPFMEADRAEIEAKLTPIDNTWGE